MRRPPAGIRGALALLAAWALAAGAEPLPEPPPEAPEGEDYAAEPADSLARGNVELGIAATGRAGSPPIHSRRVRISDRSFSGSVREGSGDPLAGGTLETDVLSGRLGVGRLAPRWGRGLVMGATAEPWSFDPPDRGRRAPLRGRAGKGVSFQADRRISLEALHGSFSKRSLSGARLGAWPAGIAALTDRAGKVQSSLALRLGPAEQELAMDRTGRWRAEVALLGRRGTRSVAARARGGHTSFRSLAEPGRSGPARALAMELSDGSRLARIRAAGALWRFRPGLGGARATLEVERRLNHHEVLAVGLEEQHGARRETARDMGFRQGAWAEWRGGMPALALGLRHEIFGAQRLARDAVRVLTAARLEARVPRGASLRVTHWEYRVGRGESLYLPEASSDRLVLRAVSGSGRRTRLELRAPGAGGWIEAALTLAEAGGTRAGAPLRVQWALGWTRRARS